MKGIFEQVEGQIKRARRLALRQMDLRRLHVAALPDSIGYLVALLELDLSESELVSLPESIGQLVKLRRLDLAQSEKLRSLPRSFGGLTGLQHLVLTGSSLQGHSAVLR